MSRLGEFIADIRMSFLVALAVFVVCTLSVCGIYEIRKSNSETRIRFYQIFTHEKTLEWSQSLEGQFVTSVRSLFFPSQEEKQTRMQAYDVLQGNAFASLRYLFFELKSEQRYALVNGSTSIVDILLEQEQQYRKQIRRTFS